MTITVRDYVGLTMKRFRVLAAPHDGEPSPVADGATPAEWAALAGVHRGAPDAPHESLTGDLAKPLDIAPNQPANVAHLALQQLTLRSITERVGGLPMRYRPLVKK
jgi:hypothetical protein